MKRTFGILFAVTLMVVMTGNLFAQGMMDMTKETGKEAEAAESGTKNMMGSMCKKMMGEKGMMEGGMMQGMMGGKGMMGGDMMCPMCKKMMGEKGMMGGSGMMAGKPHLADMAEALDLSEEQQAELKTLHIAHKKDMIRKKADKEIAEIDLQELIGQDEVDLDAVEEKLKEIASLEVQTKYAWVRLLVDSKSLLTAEQKAKFKKLKKGKKGSMMMMGKMMGGKKAEAGKPAPKSESGGHEEHH